MGAAQARQPEGFGVHCVRFDGLWMPTTDGAFTYRSVFILVVPVDVSRRLRRPRARARPGTGPSADL